jgi:anti-anti-sigma regulatory factor
MVGNKVGAMLKITVHDAAGQLCVQLEGRLAGAWVSELECCWHTARASQPCRTLVVDLTSVTFIDQAGCYLLQLMHRDGVRVVASGLMRQDILEHIMGTSGGTRYSNVPRPSTD